MANKTRLSIFLIKEAFSELDSIVTECGDPITVGDSAALFVRRSNEKIPGWVDSFFEKRYGLDQLTTSTVSALLVVEVPINDETRRYFALSFGYGRYMLCPESIEPRFGLKTVLNMVESDSLRRVDKTNVAGNARKTSEQMPIQSNVSEFSIDVERDLLEGVTAICPPDSLFEGAIAGKDALSCSSERTIDSIGGLLPSLFSIYESDNYKNEFPWVDQIAPVKDRLLIGELENAVIQKINNGSTEIWMAVPEVIKWEDVSGFRCPGSDEMMDDIDIDVVRASFRDGLTQYDQLKRKTISAVGSVNDVPIHKWAASKCLYGELSHGGKCYCLNNGDWYQVDATYSDYVEEQYKLAKKSDVPFIAYKENTNEKDYNEALADSNADRFVLMDRKLIHHGAGHSAVELCDVYERSGKYIHIKRYSGSAALSHLFNQGFVSARLMRSDPEFAKKASDKLTESAGEAIAVDANNMQEVVYGIISKKDDALNIPFFSKVAFISVAQQLKAMGVEVSVAGIN